MVYLYRGHRGIILVTIQTSEYPLRPSTLQAPSRSGIVGLALRVFREHVEGLGFRVSGLSFRFWECFFFFFFLGGGV